MSAPAVSHFVGLDIGTSLVRCVVGMVDPTQDEGLPSIIGHGSAPNLGMRKGVVVHVEDVAQAITSAITEAERISGVRITAATVNVNGSHLKGTNSRGVVAISAANREITDDDRFRAEEAATIMQLPANREIIQIFAKNYRVDGQDNIKDPVGMRGVRLEVDTHIVTTSTPSLRSLDMAIEKAQLGVNHHTVSSVACAEAVLNRQQKEAGTLLLDVGAGTTNMLVIEDGEVQHVAVIPMGGTHITNDLAIGLKTDLEIAEAVKVQHGSLASPTKGHHASISMNSKNHSFDPAEIRMIIEARVDEILEYVEKELRKIQKSRKLPGGVVLVGGSANLPGIAEFTRDELQLAARKGVLQTTTGLVDAVQDLSYVTPIGLMLLDMLLSSQHNAPNNQKRSFGLLNSVSGLWTRVKNTL